MSCDEIRDEFNNNFYVSQVEKDFPIAYIFVVYTNAGQVLRLLKSIYRPQNLYCIHPDARQGKRFKEFFTTVAKCLDNVFVVSKPVKVYYGHISITNAQLQCMQDLEKYPQSRWRYVINLCGREVPVKTNREIVESLMKLRGYSP
ncbi:Beta-1,3-galactosyl-O-glycosyl-glycoprotein beta-1,6-N-acetylglucosaminyltransferase 3 [Geodia barretti]|uniref:Beta-1,3-galactosyl-O-glycosyl-glycoprotein beta-1,6-N-acetylglucosaminyltransferase 3 n=1 Tax=Geodia barretti TaxID=519541 RepID=A0AA35WFF9_GEOBA|nr:Beta-1,3-galactosyl-O-glycosyl-glycoprotein beta-1,6-N-acetylglucosaminyltransferase 3 [Geodia barretti]